MTIKKSILVIIDVGIKLIGFNVFIAIFIEPTTRFFFANTIYCTVREESTFYTLPNANINIIEI